MRLSLFACFLTTVVVAACASSSAKSTSGPSSSAASSSSSGAGGSVGTSSSSSSSSSGAGASDGGAQSDAGPIVAPDDTWTWVDVPGSRCASGTETGFAVNPHAGSTELVIYLEGGGECYDATTCWGPSPSAKNVAGYDESAFTSPSNDQLDYPTLARSPANPFGAMNMAYVPYCTGDMHAGTLEKDLTVDGGTIPTYFYGANDMDLFLARLAPTFPGLTRVVLLGTSAGGFGTYLSFDKVVKTFNVRVDIVDDSGPPIAQAGQSSNEGLFTVWGIAAPTGCSPCTSFLDVMKAARVEQPQSRFGFLSFSWDTTIGPDFGYTSSTYLNEIDALFMNFASDPNVHTYIVTSQSGHVVESVGALASDYLPWMTTMVTDGGTWMNGTYP